MHRSVTHFCLILCGLLASGCEAPVARPELQESSTAEPLQQEGPPEGSFSLDRRPIVTDDSLALFNGSNLDGWSIIGESEDWSVNEGVLLSEDASEARWVRFNEPLEDFVLRLDWRVSQEGRSGVFLRAEEEGNPSETGLRIGISGRTSDEQRSTCALSGHVAPSPKPVTAAETWHTFEIRSQGARISVSSDGVRCLDVDQSSVPTLRDKPLQGYIGLQASRPGPNSRIEFRNIRLKFLEP